MKKIQIRTDLGRSTALKFICIIIVLFLGLKKTTCNAQQDENSSSGEKVFFAFDNRSIPWQHNLKVTMVEAEKYPGNPVVRRGPEGSPDHGHAVLYGTVIKDGDKFRMWYLGKHETHNNGSGWWRPMCYAESSDGIHWTKPNLNLVEFNGNKRNNICLIEGNPHSLTKVNDYLSILYEPGDPDPSRRYKAVYIAHVPYADIKGGMSKVGKKEGIIGSFIAATSADGFSWKVVGDRPVNAGGERFEVSGIYKFGNFYYASGQLVYPWTWRADGSKIGRSMLTYRSADFVNWTQAKALSFARPGQLTNPPLPGQESHMGVGIWNRGNVIVGLYGRWELGYTQSPEQDFTLPKAQTTVDLGLVISNDGIFFREPVPDHKVIRRGKKGEWDDMALLQAHAFVNEGDKTMIWYSHWDTGGTVKNMEIGLATIRRDGFGYLSRMYEQESGHFITTAFKAGHGGSVVINVDGATPDAPLIIELLDSLGNPLTGYSGDWAAKVTTNSTRQYVVWPKTMSSSMPAGRELSLKVTFPMNSNAHVFALYIGE